MVGRVLVVHNAYQHGGDEDAVVEVEIRLLRQRWLLRKRGPLPLLGQLTHT